MLTNHWDRQKREINLLRSYEFYNRINKLGKQSHKQQGLT